MSDKTNEIIASNLTIAFYSGQEQRKAYLGVERRKENSLLEGQRDFRESTLTPAEVHKVYERFLSMLNSETNS